MPSYKEWNNALADYFLKSKPAFTPILLSSDAETLELVGKKLGLFGTRDEIIRDFIDAIKDVILRDQNNNHPNVRKRIQTYCSDWSIRSQVAFFCAQVYVASTMDRKKNGPYNANNYYGRFVDIFDDERICKEPSVVNVLGGGAENDRENLSWPGSWLLWKEYLHKYNFEPTVYEESPGAPRMEKTLRPISQVIRARDIGDLMECFEYVPADFDTNQDGWQKRLLAVIEQQAPKSFRKSKNHIFDVIGPKEKSPQYRPLLDKVASLYKEFTTELRQGNGQVIKRSPNGPSISLFLQFKDNDSLKFSVHLKSGCLSSKKMELWWACYQGAEMYLKPTRSDRSGYAKSTEVSWELGEADKIFGNLEIELFDANNRDDESSLYVRCLQALDYRLFKQVSDELYETTDTYTYGKPYCLCVQQGVEVIGASTEPQRIGNIDVYQIEKAPGILYIGGKRIGEAQVVFDGPCCSTFIVKKDGKTVKAYTSHPTLYVDLPENPIREDIKLNHNGQAVPISETVETRIEAAQRILITVELKQHAQSKKSGYYRVELGESLLREYMLLPQLEFKVAAIDPENITIHATGVSDTKKISHDARITRLQPQVPQPEKKPFNGLSVATIVPELVLQEFRVDYKVVANDDAPQVYADFQWLGYTLQVPIPIVRYKFSGSFHNSWGSANALDVKASECGDTLYVHVPDGCTLTPPPGVELIGRDELVSIYDVHKLRDTGGQCILEYLQGVEPRRISITIYREPKFNKTKYWDDEVPCLQFDGPWDGLYINGQNERRKILKGSGLSLMFIGGQAKVDFYVDEYGGNPVSVTFTSINFSQSELIGYGTVDDEESKLLFWPKKKYGCTELEGRLYVFAEDRPVYFGDCALNLENDMTSAVLESNNKRCGNRMENIKMQKKSVERKHYV